MIVSGLSLLPVFLLTAISENLAAIQPPPFLHHQYWRCLTAIVSQYFNPNLTLLLSSFNLDINLSANQPVAIFTPEIPYQHFDEKDKHGSYILLTTDVSDIQKQLAILVTLPSWNCRGKFLVVVNEEKLTTDNTTIVRSVLSKLWDHRVMNADVLVRKRSQDFELDIWTWYPYQGLSRCFEVEDVVLLDTWRAGFINGVNMYPNKVSKNLNKCSLLVSTNDLYPFIGKPYQTESGEWNYTDGLELKILRIITHHLNLSEKFLPPVEMYWDAYFERENYTGFQADISYRGADIAFSAVRLQERSATLNDVTKVYTCGPWKWLVPCPAKVPRWRSIVRVFTYPVWIVLFISMIVAAIVMLMFTRRESNWGNVEWKTYSKLSTCLSHAWSAILGVGVPVLPRCEPLRIMFVSWVVYCLALNNVFQAFLTSFLIDPGLEHQINSLEELLTSKLKFGYAPDLDIYFQDMPEVIRRREDCTDWTKCIDWVAMGNFSTVWSVGTIEMDSVKYGKRLVCYFGPDIFTTNLVFYISKGHPLTRRIDQLFGWVIEAGLFVHWWYSEINFLKIKAKKYKVPTLMDDYVNLAVDHLQGAFYLHGLGLLLSLFVFMCEVLRAVIPHLLSYKILLKSRSWNTM